jgi:hypothetical protein
MNELHEPMVVTKYPNMHVIITPVEMPVKPYTKEDRRRDILRFVRQVLTYIGFVILMLGLCVGVSLLLAGTKWLGIWLMVCLWLGWLTSAVRVLFFN